MDRIENLILEYLSGKVPDYDAATELKIAVERRAIGSRFSENEITWLHYNFDLIPRIMNSRMCSHIFAHIYNARAAYLRQLMRLMHRRKISRSALDNTRPVLYWLRKLEMASLLVSYRQRWGNVKYYMLNKKVLPEVIQLIYEQIVKKHFTG
jgi:hypothetical protein